MIKILAFDTETTGLNQEYHEIIQLSGCICIGETAGSLEPVQWFDLRARPDKPETAAPEALAVHGYTLEQLAEFPKRQSMFLNLIDIFLRYVNKFDRTDKLLPFGYNVDFDLNMLSAFGREFDPKYGIGSYVSWHKLDVMGRLAWKVFAAGSDELPSFKLSAVCEKYGIEITAHDALSDITATMKLANAINACRFSGDLIPFNVVRNYELPAPAEPELNYDI